MRESWQNKITTLSHKLTLTILSPFVHDTGHNDVAGDATGKAISATGKADVASTTEHPHTRTGDDVTTGQTRVCNDAHSATTGRNADVGRKADVAFEATGTGDDDASTGRAVSYDATYAHDAYATSPTYLQPVHVVHVRLCV